MLLFVALLRLLICCHAVSKQHHVYPRILQERSTTGNLVVELGENITLNLQRSTVLAENLLFITSSKGLHEVETIDTSEIQANIYHDTHYQSSLMVRKSEGNVEVEGIINDNLRIRPLPAGQRSTRGQMLHKIFEIELTKENLINTKRCRKLPTRGAEQCHVQCPAIETRYSPRVTGHAFCADGVRWGITMGPNGITMLRKVFCFH